jgi:predicted methyltransferase
MSHGHHHHHHLDDPHRDEWQRPAEVIAMMELAAGMIVADLGAGLGYFEPHLSRAVGPQGRVLALDVEPSHLRQRLSGLANVEIRQITSADPALADSSVDRILLVDVWHHVQDRVEYGKKLKRALKPGGRVYLVDRPHDSPHAPPVEMRLSATQVLSELTSAGFDARVEKTLPKQFVVLALPR